MHPDNDERHRPKHIFPLWRIKQLGGYCLDETVTAQSATLHPSPFSISLPSQLEKSEKTNQHASDDGLTTHLPIQLLSRLHGKGSPWKWLKGNNTLQREIDLNVKTWPSSSFSQVITFGACALYGRVVSPLWCGKPGLPNQGSSRLPWKEKLKSTLLDQINI